MADRPRVRPLLAKERFAGENALSSEFPKIFEERNARFGFGDSIDVNRPSR